MLDFTTNGMAQWIPYTPTSRLEEIIRTASGSVDATSGVEEQPIFHSPRDGAPETELFTEKGSTVRDQELVTDR